MYYFFYSCILFLAIHLLLQLVLNILSTFFFPCFWGISLSADACLCFLVICFSFSDHLLLNCLCFPPSTFPLMSSSPNAIYWHTHHLSTYRQLLFYIVYEYNFCFCYPSDSVIFIVPCFIAIIYRTKSITSVYILECY